MQTVIMNEVDLRYYILAKLHTLSICQSLWEVNGSCLNSTQNGLEAKAIALVLYVQAKQQTIRKCWTNLRKSGDVVLLHATWHRWQKGMLGSRDCSVFLAQTRG